jgi:hypothetical protein
MVTKLKETLISSLFIHLILFWIIAAVASHTTGFSAGFQNIVLVDLTKDLPAAGTASSDEPPVVSSPASNEKVSVSDQAVNNPAEELEAIPEHEKKPEAITEAAKIENAEKPLARRGGFTSLQDYYRFITLHKQIFRQRAGATVSGLVGEALKVNTREFFGGTAIVSLKYGPDGTLSGVFVDSASPELKAFLEEIAWGPVPAPASYSLKYYGVQIEFTVLEGHLSIKIDAL